jgi:hypothetical protein
MDKRKNNGGHSTKATKPDDRRLNPYKDVVREAITADDLLNVLKMLYNKSVEKQDVKAAQLLLEYTVGKPKQEVDLGVTQDSGISFLEMLGRIGENKDS